MRELRENGKRKEETGLRLGGGSWKEREREIDKGGEKFQGRREKKK